MSQLSDKLIQEGIQRFKSYKAKARRKQNEKHLNYYSGTSLWTYIQPYFSIDAFKEIPVYESNITRKFINKMSRVYTIAPERKSSAIYKKMTKVKDLKMKHVERMTRLVGTLATEICFDYEKQLFTYNPIYYYDCFFREDEPFNPAAIIYPILNPVDDVSYSYGTERFCYLDEYIKRVYDASGNIESEEEHYYDILPVAFTHKEEQLDSFFVEGAADIINANEHVNITLTEMQLGLRFQMFGQPYATGVYEDSAVTRTGSNVIINLPEGAQYGIATPGGNIRDVIENLKFQISLVAQNNHLMVYFEENADRPSSGLALLVKDFERMEDYKDDLEMWRIYEHNIYDIEKAIAAANNISLPDSFSIKFIEPEYPKSVQEQISKDKWEMEQGFTSKEDILIREERDLTKPQAKKIINKNLESQPKEEPIQENTFPPKNKKE